MMTFANSINEGWYRLLYLLMEDGSYDVYRSSPRGMETREILGAQLRLRDPHKSILGIPERKLNYSFLCAEALWMISGLNQINLIEPYNLNLGKFAADPGALHFQGAYGPRIVDQIDYVVDTLRKDPDSRQALISIWRPRPRASADIACTVSMQFFNRDGLLHMHTYMRSQDVVLGMPYDIFSFTLIQAFIAYRLDLYPGPYTHTMGSLHLYERNFDMSRSILDSNGVGYVQHSRAPMESAPIAVVMAAYIELTAIAPGFAYEESRMGFIEEWWERTYDALNGHQPWTDLLAVCARRFHPKLNRWVDGGWDELIGIGR